MLTVGYSKRSTTFTSLSVTPLRSFPWTWSRASECPPRSKKFSFTPITSTPRTSRQMAAISRSRSSRGGTSASSGRDGPSGTGSARRSTLPFGFKGSRSSVTYAAGTMWSGRLAWRAPRSTPASIAWPWRAVTYATSRLSPGRSSLAITTASFTPGCRARADSISPSSMRYPRSFTWWSTRPRNSMAPSARYFTRSPVR